MTHRKRLLFTAVVLATLTLPIWVSANKEDAVVEMYNSSSNLPNAQAYKGFLGLVEAIALMPGHETHFIKDALGINDDTKEEIARATSQLEWFLASAKSVRAEADSAKLKALCPSGWADMSFKEIQDARWAFNDTEDGFYEEYYNAALKHLSASEKSAFLQYMEGLKKNSSFTRIDTERLYGDKAEGKARDYQAGVCATAKTDPNNA